MSKKKPKAKPLPTGKSLRLGMADPEGTNHQTPVWSIAVFDHAGPWGRAKCETEGHLWDEIFPKLRDYESMTWGEIYRNKKRDHSVPVGGISKEAQERLVQLRLDDVDELFRFRLSGKMRVWGIRDGRVFQLLWWDPDHAIWPVDPN